MYVCMYVHIRKSPLVKLTLVHVRGRQGGPRWYSVVSYGVLNGPFKVGPMVGRLTEVLLYFLPSSHALINYSIAQKLVSSISG